jgi:hypothetical protein
MLDPNANSCSAGVTSFLIGKLPDETGNITAINYVLTPNNAIMCHRGDAGSIPGELTLVLVRVLTVPLLIIIPSLLHTHISPPPEVYDSPGQAAHYHILSHEVGGFIPDPVTWLVTE